MVLGLAVGKGSTPLDDHFREAGEVHPELGRLLVFTDGRVSFSVWAVVLAVALWRRRRRLSAVVAVSPFVAVLTARLAKRAFGRFRGDALAYPSGHTTLAVVVLGMAVLVAGMAAWAVVSAAVVAVFAALGQAFTYHYFTDAVGALFLGTALVAAAAWAAKLDRCQPSCDLRHRGG
ncbi:PA-phosphatase [Mycolicibacterium chubuense]|uniref:PA-phosphatase n=1 Tax=Mycolicibacterium chubuense TaxID=1800 RepID=UPI00031847BF|nr:PA-phosphatase [Mycolicibacterium chubuense]